jgi:hypothetical protein
MKQNTINPANRNAFNASFQQKRTGLSLIITRSAAAMTVIEHWLGDPQQ